MDSNQYIPRAYPVRLSSSGATVPRSISSVIVPGNLNSISNVVKSLFTFRESEIVEKINFIPEFWNNDVGKNPV